MSARIAALVIVTLQLHAWAAEPALPPGPEWKSGEIRRSDDGALKLVPGRRPVAAPRAAAGSQVRPKPKLGRGTRAVVSWSAPKTYADGRPIRGPLGYKVYYGERFGRYSKTVNAGGRTRVTIEGLVPGKTYYFVVTAYTPQGAESSHSKPVAVQISP